MNGLWSKEQVEKAKNDPRVRERIRAELEESVSVGNMQPCYPGALSNYYDMAHRVVTEDAIRQFCRGIGDFNPLYCKPEYAEKSVYGSILAPPHFIHAISPPEGVAGGRMPDYITAFINAGVQIQWFRTMREGDKMTVLTGATDVKDVTKEDSALQFLVRGRKLYKNQRDEVVAIAMMSSIRIIQPITDGKTEAVSRMEQVAMVEAPIRYFSDQELEEWYRLTEQEEIRGAKPRFWEDVNVGDELPPTRHLATLAQTLAYRGGCGFLTDWRLIMARKKEMDKKAMPMDPYWTVVRRMTPEPLQGTGGLRRPLVSGVILNCWLGRLVTNWMGDTGFLKKTEERYRKPLMTDALVTCTGKVVKKYVQDNEHLVDLHTTLEDHNGILVVSDGLATVVLPSRIIDN